jgi:PAS domain S-box-containing protein
MEVAMREGDRDSAAAAEAVREAGVAQGAPLRQVEALDAAIVASVLDAIIGADLNGTILSWNLGAERIYGYSPEEAVGRPLTMIVPPDRRPELARMLAIAGGGEPVPLYRGRHLRRDGQVVPISASIGPIRDRQGQVVGVAISAHDDSHHVQVEEERAQLLAEVQEEAAELDSIIASAVVGLAIYNGRGEIVRTNPAARAILGYSDEELAEPIAVRMAGLKMTRPDGTPIPVEETPPMRALRGETMQSFVVVIHRPSEREVWIAGTAGPILAPGGQVQGAVVTFVDITARRELEEQREDLLRAVSHDLRNPLTVVQTNAQLLLRTLDRRGEEGLERKQAEGILTSARRMNAMIQDLVDATRLEAGLLTVRPKPVELRPFVEELLRRQAGILDTERIHIADGQDLPAVLADPDRVERILVNLLANALKYSAPGSPVTVSLYRRDGEVVTAVSDLGPGIPPGELPRIFQRFYRGRVTSVRGEGLGLGLHITKGLVEALGGRIWAESEVGVGSTFSFSLPVAG